VQFLSSTQLLSGQRQQQSWQITYATDKGAAQQLDCDLLVGADGQHSKVRCFNRIPSMVTPYAQYAIIGQITSTQALPQVALERFTQDGALAILPKGGQQYTFIWTVGVACYRAYMNLSDRDFLQSLQQQLGYRIGRLQSLQHKIALPLSGVKAQTQIGYHSLLVGNAAHYLHPIAAQGLNLTLRDIQYFSQLYQQRLPTTKQQLQSLLEDYERQRYPDQAILWSVTEILAQYISGDKLPGWLKALGIGGLESLPLLKKAFTQYAMGWRGN
jgi:2-polyprenyl-6-methoxyphenol hydroxylase-like FAD-dependent oxidoreductase